MVFHVEQVKDGQYEIVVSILSWISATELWVFPLIPTHCDFIILTLKVDLLMCGDWIDWRDGGERGQDDLQGFGLAIGVVWYGDHD